MPDRFLDAWQCIDDGKGRTLLPGGLLDLGGKAVSYEPVAGLELLHGLGAVVDESETGALAATEVCLEAEDRDIFLLGLVKLTELGAELVLGDVCAVGVEDIAIWQPSDLVDRNYCQYRIVYSMHLHDHLATTEERVADELARAQGNLRVGHDGGMCRPAAC